MGKDALMADKPENNLSPENGGNQEELNLDALLSGIKRVNSDSSSTPVKPASTGSSKQASAPRPAPSKETASNKSPNKEAPVNGQPVRIPATAKKKPANHSASADARRKEIEAKRKRASIILGVATALIALAIGTGIFFAIKQLNKPGETSLSDGSGSITSTSEAVRGTGTSEDTTSSSSEESTEPSATPTPAPTPFPAGGPDLSGYCVVIDAGHQEVANLEQESMSSSMGGSKAKSSEGFSGVVSGINESEINLSVELLLKSYLESLGCEVYVTRETNDVDISNKERAEMAVSYDPDLYIRLYCNAANDSMANGIEVIVPSGGKYSSEVTGWGQKLGETVASATGSTFNSCTASGNYSGLNWANSVPAFMLRMGYLSNSDDESKLLDEEYQFLICQGIGEFIATMPK